MPRSDGGPGEAAETRKLDQVTALLCDVLKYLEKRPDESDGSVLTPQAWVGLPPDLSTEVPGLSAWWTEHQRQDEIRKASEKRDRDRARARAVALSKLTVEERQLLNLHP